MFQFLSVILVILILGIIPIVHAQIVPDWVKNTAGWWATDAISETEFVNAIEFLANEGSVAKANKLVSMAKAAKPIESHVQVRSAGVIVSMTLNDYLKFSLQC